MQKERKRLPGNKGGIVSSLRWTGERIIPEEGRYMFERHLKAYQFAKDFCQDKYALDAGCGEGYGSNLLAEIATKATGIDISDEANKHAKNKYVRDNLEYKIMDVQKLDFEDELFDVVVSFQVIEHLHDAVKFLEEVKRVLKKGGLAIISTPNKSMCKGSETGKYHEKEYCYDEYVDLLNNNLGKSEYYGVHIKSCKHSRLKLTNLISKLDVFKIRRLFSSGLRRKTLIAIEKGVSLEITNTKLNSAVDIIGVYRKS